MTLPWAVSRAAFPQHRRAAGHGFVPRNMPVRLPAEPSPLGETGCFDVLPEKTNRLLIRTSSLPKRSRAAVTAEFPSSSLFTPRCAERAVAEHSRRLATAFVEHVADGSVKLSCSFSLT